MSKTFLDKDNNILATVYETHEIVANPKLEGNEPELTGLLIGNNKYKAGAGGTSVPIVESLPETGEEGDLVVLKTAKGKTVMGTGDFYYVKNGDSTALHNDVKKQLNISEKTYYSIIPPCKNLDEIGKYTIKIDSVEELIGHKYMDLSNAYFFIEDLKLENYLLECYTDGGNFYSRIDIGPVEYEKTAGKSVISGDKLYRYFRRINYDGARQIITGVGDWELSQELTIIRLENKDEFIDFHALENRDLVIENNELYGEGNWVYLGEFSKPIYAGDDYLLYCYGKGQWNVVAPSVVANPELEGNEKFLQGIEVEGTKYQTGPVRYDMECLAIEAGLNPLTHFNLDAVELGNQIAKTVDDLDEIILDTTFVDTTYIQIMYGHDNNTADNAVILISVTVLLENAKDFAIDIEGDSSSKYIEFRESEGSWFPTGYEGQLTFRHLIQILEHISSDGVIGVIPRLIGGRTNRIVVLRDKIEEYESFTIPDLIEFVSTVFVPAGGSSSSSSN